MNRTLCRHLRAKQMYIDAQADDLLVEKEGVEASPCYFWCNLTQTTVGPDDRPANKSVCTPSRPCFEE
jgi:hypothetical protein